MTAGRFSRAQVPPSASAAIEPRSASVLHEAPGQRFRDAADESRRCRAEQKETSRILRPIDEDAEELEQIGSALHFINDDEPRQLLERRHGSRESAEIDRVLEVEELAGRAPRNHPCESRLPALAGAEKRALPAKQAFGTEAETATREKDLTSPGRTLWTSLVRVAAYALLR